MAVRYFTDLMVLDEDEELKAKKAELLEEELEAFMDGVLDFNGESQEANSGWLLSG